MIATRQYQLKMWENFMRPRYSTLKLHKLYSGKYFLNWLDISAEVVLKISELTIHDFWVTNIIYGTEVLVKTSDELTENNRVNLEIQEDGVMMATGTDKCPVAANKFYASKLHPKGKAFFLRPKAQTQLLGCTGPWSLGVKSLKKMREIRIPN